MSSIELNPHFLRVIYCGAAIIRPVNPFAGAGTTLAVAKRLGRHYLGSDLNADSVKLARQRLAGTGPAPVEP